MLSYVKLFLIIIHTIICSVLAMIFSLIDRSHFLYFKLAKYFSGGVLFLSGVKLKINGLENFDHKKPYVFVSNHASQYDIPAIQASVPNRISIIYKKELHKIPVFGWQLKMGPYISIDRKNRESAMKSLDEAGELMDKRKMSPIVFAEGTRSLTGEVQKFKRGAFLLASKSGHPIVPVSISGSYNILPKGKFKINSGTIKIHFGKPIIVNHINSKEDELNLIENVRNIIIQNMQKEN